MRGLPFSAAVGASGAGREGTARPHVVGCGPGFGRPRGRNLAGAQLRPSVGAGTALISHRTNQGGATDAEA